jgi:hypothetical protein
MTGALRLLSVRPDDLAPISTQVALVEDLR